jgi:hypothetical protein
MMNPYDLWYPVFIPGLCAIGAVIVGLVAYVIWQVRP